MEGVGRRQGHAVEEQSQQRTQTAHGELWSWEGPAEVRGVGMTGRVVLPRVSPSLDVGCSGRRSDLGGGSFLLLRAVFWQHLLSVGELNLSFLKENG